MTQSVGHRESSCVRLCPFAIFQAIVDRFLVEFISDVFFERGEVMTKSLVFTLLAIAGTMICADDAHARCCRRARCCMPVASCCAAPSCVASCGTCAATVDQPAATVASTNSSTYQSFSYEPGSTTNAVTTTPVAPVTTYQAPVPMARRSTWSEFDNVLRGDRKSRGL